MTYLQCLEKRVLFAAVVPTDVEQYELELINRARANPAAEATRFGIDLNEGLAAGTISTAAKQPLAMNLFIVDAARKHSQWMIDNDKFQHEGPGNNDPGDRIAAAGYALVAPYTWGENIAYRSTKPAVPDPYPTSAQLHQDLFVDAGIEHRGHRTNMMSDSFKEIGVGTVSGEFNTFNAVMLTTDFAASGTGSFVTGVAFDDNVTVDNFYSPGEGLGSVTVTATRIGDGAVFSTTTWSTGGYSLKLNDGQYIVRATGGELGSRTLTYANVGIAGKNLKCDFRPAHAGIVRGAVYSDTNVNGAFDTGEGFVGGVLLYIDTHRDGKRNKGELYARSNSGGAYAFRDLMPGNYRVREQLPPGKSLIAPVSGYYTANLTAAKILGGRSFGNAPTVPGITKVRDLLG